MWWSAVAAASLTVLGDPAFRAPDGISMARVADDGSAWVISARGEVSGFDPKGHLKSTFQACPDRGPHGEFYIDRHGTRAAVPCDGSVRVFDLAAGTLLFEHAVFAAHADFSPNGRTLGVLGERIVDGVSEDTSYLLRYDATTGEALAPRQSDWEALYGVRGGWVGATQREDDGPMLVEGIIQAGARELRWRWKAPPELHTSEDWGPREALAVLDGGAAICVQLDFGGSCHDGRTGGLRALWSVPAAARTSENRAEPHPDGFVVGKALWFVRQGGIQAWTPGNDPVEKATSTVPVANTANTHRYQVGEARLVRAGAPADDWDLPRTVDLSVDGRMLVLADSRGVVAQQVGGGARALPYTASTVRIRPDGEEIWSFDPTASVHGVSDGSKRSAGWTQVAFDANGTTWAVRQDDTRTLVRWQGSEEPRVMAELPDALELTGLQVRGELDKATVLLEYAQDDAWQISTPSGVGALNAHAFMDYSDLLLLDDGTIGMTEVDDGWQVGRITVPYTTTVRFLPDGTRFVTLPGDGQTLQVRAYPSGSIQRSVELPGRFHTVRVVDTTAIVVLRDGRVVLVGL